MSNSRVNCSSNSVYSHREVERSGLTCFDTPGYRTKLPNDGRTRRRPRENELIHHDADRPPRLAAYVVFVDRTLARWREQGAVAIKFADAYFRTLRYDDVPQKRADELYARGRTEPLSREEHLEVQDFLARHVFRQAGLRTLPVHIHSSSGTPPFLRLGEAAVQNLESVLTDPATSPLSSFSFMAAFR